MSDQICLRLTKEELDHLFKSLLSYSKHLEPSADYVQEVNEWKKKVLKLVQKVANSFPPDEE